MSDHPAGPDGPRFPDDPPVQGTGGAARGDSASAGPAWPRLGAERGLGETSADTRTPTDARGEPTTPDEAAVAAVGLAVDDAATSAERRGDLAPALGDAVNGYEDADPYADVPASLELAYTTTDLGLGERAFERSYPYDLIERRRRRGGRARFRRIGRELVETVVLALLIFFAVKAVIQNFRVEGASMEPSMSNNQYLLVNKALYYRVNFDRVHQFLPFVPGDGEDEERHLFRAPRRGDVIVFRFPLDTERDFIKRVIGVPGDTVEVRDQMVFINGAPLQEDYISSPPNYTYGPKTVPEGAYFVLGDNRNNSFDSHAWCNGRESVQNCDFVPEENIIGQAWVTYWPFDQLGFINNDALKPQAP